MEEEEVPQYAPDEADYDNGDQSLYGGGADYDGAPPYYDSAADDGMGGGYGNDYADDTTAFHSDATGENADGGFDLGAMASNFVDNLSDGFGGEAQDNNGFGFAAAAGGYAGQDNDFAGAMGDFANFNGFSHPDDAQINDHGDHGDAAVPIGMALDVDADTEPNFTETRDADGNITLAGTGGDDNYNVSAHYEDTFMNSALSFVGLGEFRTSDGVTVTDGEGDSRNYLGADADRLRISGGDGDDRIHIDDNVNNNINLFGGNGNDSLIGGGGQNIIDGGDGRDYIDGGRGNDMIDGGLGNDALYGGYGDDAMSGGDGRDFVEGGRGNDSVDGGLGNDIVSGGRGDDMVRGGLGDDTLYAGEGTDTVYGGEGTDRLYADANDQTEGGGQAGDTAVTDMNFDANLGSSVRSASGSTQEFNDRLEQDLDMLRYSPTGQVMLNTMDSTGRTVTISEIDSPNGGTADVAPSLDPFVGSPFMNPLTGANGAQRDAVIGYNPAHNQFYGGDTPGNPNDDWKDVSPVEELFHEMSHTQDYMTGTLFPGQYGTAPYSGNDARDTGMNNRERDAVGLPIDHDGNPSTPEQTVNRPELTENGLRREFGSQPRPTYNNS